MDEADRDARLLMMSPAPSRRNFLTGAGAAALAGLAAACNADNPSEPTAETADQSSGSGAQVSATPERVSPPSARAVPFIGHHQAGVVQPATASGLVATFDVLSSDRGTLEQTMIDLSAEIERIMSGDHPDPADEFLPPVDSGAVDRDTSTIGTAITLGVGATLFDERFGLADRRPVELIPMPTFFNDRLVRPDFSHGDLVLTVTAPSRQTVAYALQQAVRVTDRRLGLRWVQEGYNELLPPSADRVAPARNLMGFRDGTSNLDVSDPEVMAQHVWVGASDGEPGWAAGGTYLAVRVIRMLIEFWATAAQVRQEQIFGRHRETGAPLGQQLEGDQPSFALDPTNLDVAPRSHIRLANPRAPGTGRILRRGFSYLNGADTSTGTLDQGLLFLAHQRSLNRGFLEVQSRLDGEPLEDYIKPVGGGLFFLLPGPERDGWLGAQLFA